jgi:putative tricarboxylic transport membrane protein
MAQKGHAGDALKAALVASTLGGIISCFSLMFFAPQLAKVALSFQAPEFFALCIFGMSAAIGIAGEKILKGLVMVILGLC